MKILLTHCNCFHYEEDKPVTSVVHIEIDDEKIAAIHHEIPKCNFDRVIDCKYSDVLPGGIDPHVHMSTKSEFSYGKAYVTISADSFKTGSLAAIAGGTTCFMDFVHFKPSVKETLETRLNTVKQDGCFVDYAFHIIIGNVEKIPLIKEAAKIEKSFKLFTVYNGMKIESAADLYAVMSEIAKAGAIAMVHCENDQIIQKNCKFVKSITDMGVLRPEWNEIEATTRVLVMGELTKCPVHIAHVTLPEQISIIDIYRERCQQKVTCEVTTHHFQLTSDLYKNHMFKEDLVMAPPLQAPEKVEGMKKMLMDGKIDCTCSDHCPYTRSQRHGGSQPFDINPMDLNFYEMPYGTNGVQVRFIATYGLLKSNEIPLEQIAKQVSQNAADRYQLPGKGRIAVGFDASLVVVNPNQKTVFTVQEMKERNESSLFEGKEFRGKIERVFVKGREYGVDQLLEGKYMRKFQ